MKITWTLSTYTLIPLLVLGVAMGITGAASLEANSHPTDTSNLDAQRSPLAEVLHQDGDQEPSGKDDGETKPEGPKFGDPEAQSSFDEGRELFDKDEWSAATKRFKACKGKASKPEKKVIEAWIKACKGGKSLGKVQKAISKSKWKLAWGEVSKLNARYGETPLREKLDAIAQQVQDELFLLLATFEDPPPQPEKDAGDRPAAASINTNMKFVREGKRSLRWAAAGFIAQVPLTRLDGEELEEYRYLHFSMYSPNENFGKFTLIFETDDGIPNDPTRILQARLFFHHLTVNWVGWKDFRIDLRKEIQTNSNPTLADIRKLTLLMIPPGKDKTIYVDGIKLERK